MLLCPPHSTEVPPPPVCRSASPCSVYLPASFVFRACQGGAGGQAEVDFLSVWTHPGHLVGALVFLWFIPASGPGLGGGRLGHRCPPPAGTRGGGQGGEGLSWLPASTLRAARPARSGAERPTSAAEGAHSADPHPRPEGEGGAGGGAWRPPFLRLPWAQLLPVLQKMAQASKICKPSFLHEIDF